jgi:hypothetical protein
MLEMGKLQPFVLEMLPFLGVCLGVFLLLGLGHWLLLARHPDMGIEKRFSRQLIMLGATLAGLLLILLVMPIDQGTRGQVIGLLGLLISGLLTFSSTDVPPQLSTCRLILPDSKSTSPIPADCRMPLVHCPVVRDRCLGLFACRKAMQGGWVHF